MVMRKYTLIVILGLFLLGCSTIQEKREELYVYFYYYPTCPWCKMVKPYIELLEQKAEDVSFEYCNVKELRNCSSEAISILKSVKIRGVPALVVKNSTAVKEVYIGAYNVIKFGNFLRARGYDVPTNYSIKGRNYTIKDCIDCHIKKGIKIPSTYSCSSCCHR